MPPDGVPCGVREPECNQHGRAREAACAQGSLALASGRLRGVYKPPHGERASAPRQGSPDCAQLWRYSPEPVSARGCALQARARRAASRRRAPLDGILPGQTGEQGMSEALRFVRGTKALNFCEFFIPNLAHPLNCVKGYQGRELAVTEGLSPHHPCRNYVLAAEQLADRDG